MEILEQWEDIPVYTAEDAVFTEIDRICHDERDAVRDADGENFLAVEDICRGRKAYRGSGKCCESDECGGYLSFGRGASYGCGTFDRRMQ